MNPKETTEIVEACALLWGDTTKRNERECVFQHLLWTVSVCVSTSVEPRGLCLHSRASGVFVCSPSHARSRGSRPPTWRGLPPARTFSFPAHTNLCASTSHAKQNPHVKSSDEQRHGTTCTSLSLDSAPSSSFIIPPLVLHQVPRHPHARPEPTQSASCHIAYSSAPRRRARARDPQAHGATRGSPLTGDETAVTRFNDSRRARRLRVSSTIISGRRHFLLRR